MAVQLAFELAAVNLSVAPFEPEDLSFGQDHRPLLSSVRCCFASADQYGASLGNTRFSETTVQPENSHTPNKMNTMAPTTIAPMAGRGPGCLKKGAGLIFC